MKRLVLAGRAFFGLGVAGMGIQQFIYHEFRPVFLSWPAGMSNQSIWAYIAGSMLILSGLFIAASNRSRSTAIGLGLLFLVMFLGFHLPDQIKFFQQNKHLVLGTWINPLKELALAGCAFIVAASYTGVNLSTTNRALLIAGRVLFSLMLIQFGRSHFVYTNFAATLVPGWLPGHLFWTYFGAIALIGTGICILLKIQIRFASLLLGLMLFIWFLILHIPRAMDAQAADKGNELTSVFQALAFSGVAFVLAGIYQKKENEKRFTR